MNTDTPWTDAKEFTGQAVWAEDSAPLLGCVEATYARRLERLVKDQHKALETARNKFASYNMHHVAKGTPESLEKAEVNALLVIMCDIELDSFNQLRKEMEA